MSERSPGRKYRSTADDVLQGAYEPPTSIENWVDAALEDPWMAASAAGYIVSAIESQGTRTIVERGEEKTRYVFFDDPYNEGEHAVLGNTDTLNAFVDDLRAVAMGRGKEEKIVWIDGPTATGKSELKRCLVNGLREFSKTPEGRRYTLEWNVEGTVEERGLSYGGSGDESEVESDWYRSPVQIHPLAVFPEQVREDIVGELNEVADYPIAVDTELDPFSREAYDYLEKQYRQEGRRELFSAVTDPQHLRVSNYIVDVGQGIGVLHAEDDGTPKERLVGSWMPGMLRELDSRGRKNPQAFSYDGVLSQGNGLLTIVEDASQHADLLRRLLNVPDERHVKLDKGIGMDLDTQLVVISNPDLDEELDQYAERNGTDPLKALKRRLTRHEFRYLTNREFEAELVRRELTGETAVGDPQENGIDPLRDPLFLEVRDDEGTTRERELAPHAVSAAATYSVVTRLDGEDLPPDLSLVDKAVLFEQGHIGEGDERRTVDEFDFGDDDGRNGIPVTYTRDVIADLLGEETGRTHPDLDVASVYMPQDVLDAMVEGLADAPVFSRAEAAEFENRLAAIRHHVRERQRDDVLDAMLAESGVDEETVAEYVEHVYAWDAGAQLSGNGPGKGGDPDPLKMKLFETDHLGKFGDRHYDGNEPRGAVEEFRQETVIRALTRYAWENRDDGFSVSDVDLSSIPELREVLEAHDWDDVRRIFPDFDPMEWDDPPADTETAQLKDRTIDRLTDAGYSRASAELTSRSVMREVRDSWD